MSEPTDEQFKAAGKVKQRLYKNVYEKLYGRRVPTEAQRASARAKYAKAMLAIKERDEVAAAFVHLAPVFEHFGITVTRKGMRDPVWTLRKADCQTLKVSADGSIEKIEGKR